MYFLYSSCQSRLFLAICSGDVVFPEQHGWAGVSAEARDLITRLLVRDASRRMDADAVMRHPWIAKCDAASEVHFEVEIKPEEEVGLQRQTSSNVSLAWLFDRANVVHQNNNNNINKNRKVSMNDRLMLASGGQNQSSSKRKTSMAASMMASVAMRRQTSLVFPDDNHFTNLHRCEL